MFGVRHDEEWQTFGPLCLEGPKCVRSYKSQASADVKRMQNGACLDWVRFHCAVLCHDFWFVPWQLEATVPSCLASNTCETACAALGVANQIKVPRSGGGGRKG